MCTTTKSRNAKLFRRACKTIPGGVNSPVRAFRAVGGNPLFISRGQGCYIQDEQGRQYLDYLGSWGPLILGHAHPEVVMAVQQAVELGTSYGAPTELEVRLAEKICTLFPSVEKVRLVNSGTEATMSALRLARAFTRRPLVVKFDGCYHGHSDSLLIKAGSGILTLGLADSPGVLPNVAQNTLSLPFNDLSTLEEAFATYPAQIAAIILEPVPGNMGVILPEKGFLEGTIEIAEQNETLVIFDEIISGFRLALGGAQELFSLSAPLTCLGKILGGGFPIGAYGGRREIMDLIAPQGPVYQAGTLSGNPVTVVAALKTLEILEREKPFEDLERKAAQLCSGLQQKAKKYGINFHPQYCGSMFTPFFREGPVSDLRGAKASETDRFSQFFKKMLQAGICLAPSPFEANFLSTAHTETEIDQTIERAEGAFKEIVEGH